MISKKNKNKKAYKGCCDTKDNGPRFFFSFITLTCIDTKNNNGNKIKIQIQT